MELVFVFIITPPLTTWNYLCGQIWFLSLAMLYMFCIIVLAAQRVYMGAYYNFYVPLYLIAFSVKVYTLLISQSKICSKASFICELIG